MLYVDTSVLVAALTNEATTHRMHVWLSDQNADDLAISEWVTTEFSSALSIKVRTRQIEPLQRNLLLAGFNRLIADSFAVLPINIAHFRTAARFADQYGLGLRAGDALHLAVVVEHGARLCTLDKKLSEAGTASGADVVLL
ncbi:type II toxin-antitoxin system VapC family toxin [Devosia sp.]|uniref:type II toxin-antitoxin system VapC family toxin n=1 Tax=Devosia sp. TaxID=1871048 RepID=UPI0032673E6F